jgi:hypothetical protein
VSEDDQAQGPKQTPGRRRRGRVERLICRRARVLSARARGSCRRGQPAARAHCRGVDKSDPIDAQMAARLFLGGKAKAVPKETDGIVESIRLLRAARHSAVKFRSAAMVPLRDLIITASQELRDQLSCRRTLRGKATVCARFRPSSRELRFPSKPRSSHYVRSQGDGRARVRPNQAQPTHQPVPAPRKVRRTLGVAAVTTTPQPDEAP